MHEEEERENEDKIRWGCEKNAEDKLFRRMKERTDEGTRPRDKLNQEGNIKLKGMWKKMIKLEKIIEDE